MEQKRQQQIGRSATIMSVAIIISRLTGFLREIARAFAIGNGLIAGAYMTANNLPNLLYEMVMGGMLVTAFLPVYLKAKRTLSQDDAQEFVNNITSLATLALGAVSIISLVFAAQIIGVQTFLSDNQQVADLSTYFFKFFAIQILFYGLSSIFSGVLNAERDYLWSSIAPIFNNVVTIITLLGFAFFARSDEQLAITILAIGTTLGVLVQAAIQIPAFRRLGFRFKPNFDLSSPLLKDVLRLGIPAMIVTIASSVATFLQSSAALSVADSGPSTIGYARLWYTLPHAFFAVPISTVFFTELSDWASQNNWKAYVQDLSTGYKQIILLIVPFSALLIVFSTPLVGIMKIGAMNWDDVLVISRYLKFLAPSLFLFSLCMYLMKVFSSLGKMRLYALHTVVSYALSLIVMFPLVLGVGPWSGLGLEGVAVSIFIGLGLRALFLTLHLRNRFGESFSIDKKMLIQTLFITVVGALVAAGLLWLLIVLFGHYQHSALKAFVYVVSSGLLTLVVTYGLAIKLKVDGSESIITLLNGILRRLGISRQAKSKPRHRFK